MHGNLRPRQPFSALITMPCQVTSRWTYRLPYYSVLAADTLIYAVTLTFDLWPWTCVAYRQWWGETLYQIWTKSSNPPQSYCDFSVWPFMTLNMALRVAFVSGITFTKFDFRQLIRAWIITFFDADTLCHAVTLIFDPLTLKVRGTSSVTWSKATRNLNNIEQSSTELLIISRIFAHVMSCCDPLLWPLELELL